MGNSIVSGLSPKSNQSGQLSPQTQRELEQAEKSGQVSAELARKVVEETSRGLSVGLKGSTLKVTDGKTDWGGDLNEMTSYGNLMTARRSLLSEFDMNSDSGRALDMGFMQMQAAQMRQLTQTPIEESAAYLQGMARGEARYNHINRDRIAQQQRQVQTTRQLDTLNKQTWQADQARAKMTTLEKVQLGFDIAGMTDVPVVSQIAELGSAGIALYNKDYVGAGLSFGSMLPFAGKWAESAKMQRLTERVKSYSDVVPNINTPATFGASTTSNYKKTFFEANPSTQGNVVVHHAVEQQVLKRYPGVVSGSEMHSIENLRGIPKEINPDVHLSKIRKEWNKFYRLNPKPTAQQLLDKATDIDDKFGNLFNPPVRD